MILSNRLETHLEDKDPELDDPPPVIFPLRVELLAKLIEYLCGREYESKVGLAAEKSEAAREVDSEYPSLAGELEDEVEYFERRNKVRPWCVYRVQPLLTWVRRHAAALDFFEMDRHHSRRAQSNGRGEGRQSWVDVLVRFVGACQAHVPEVMEGVLEVVGRVFEVQVQVQGQPRRSTLEGLERKEKERKRWDEDGDEDIRIENREEELEQAYAQAREGRSDGDKPEDKDVAAKQLETISTHIIPFLTALRSTFHPQTPVGLYSTSPSTSTLASPPYAAFTLHLLKLLTSTLFPRHAGLPSTPPPRPHNPNPLRPSHRRRRHRLLPPGREISPSSARNPHARLAIVLRCAD